MCITTKNILFKKNFAVQWKPDTVKQAKWEEYKNKNKNDEN